MVWDGARSGLIGKGFEGAIGSTIVALRPIDILKEYLYYFLLCKYDYINTNHKGTGIPHVDPDILWNIDVPIPPSDEQKKIVEQLEILLAKIKNVNEKTNKIPVILKCFRQSVLAAACSGKLTASWRAINKCTNAEELINEVLEKRKTRQIKKSDKIKLTEVGVDYLDRIEKEIPETWCWTSLANYATCSRGRFSVRPRNDPRCFNGEYPFIQIGDLPRDGGYINSHTQTLNEVGLGVSKMFPKGTVVIAIVGATIANTGILSYDMCFPDSLVGIESETESGNKYIEYYLRSVKEDIRQVSYAGGGQPNIKLETLEPYPIPLPPLAEQEEIVRCIDKLFAIADELEERYKKAKNLIARAEKSIYSKAFSGELVNQEIDK